MCKNVTWKLAIALAVLFDLEIEQMDAIGAFLNSEADTDIYVEVPPYWEVEGEVLKDAPEWVCKLLKALYGLKQAPRLWKRSWPPLYMNWAMKPARAISASILIRRPES